MPPELINKSMVGGQEQRDKEKPKLCVKETNCGGGRGVTTARNSTEKSRKLRPEEW